MSLVQINQSCGGAEGSHANVATGTQCFEGVVRKFWKFKKGFQLSELTETAVKTAIKVKNIVVLPDIEVMENDNTEPEIKNGRYGDTLIKEGVMGNKFIMELASCTHDQVSTYDSSSLYSAQAEVTDKNELLCQVHDDGKIEGMPVKSFLVGKRNRPVIGENPTTTIGVKYDKMTMSILKPDFDIESIEGIQPVVLTVQGTPTSSEIVVKATAGCKSDAVTGLALTDFTFTGGTLTAVSETDGVYTFTGSGLTTGDLATIVAEVGNELYEAESITVTI